MNIASLVERNIRTFGERTSMIYEGRELTNVALHEESQRLAAALVELGVAAGDRAAVLLPNSPELVTAYGAILGMGAVLVPMIFLLAVPEVHLILQEATPKVLFTSVELVGNVLQAVEGLDRPPKIVVTGDTAPDGTLRYGDLIAGREANFPVAAKDEGDLAVISFTGGTTGRPKGVMLTHGNLLAEAELVNEIVPNGPEDMGLSVLPMAHLFGMASLFASQLFGYPAVTLRWFTAEGFIESVERYRVTMAAVVPTMLTLVLNHPDFASHDLTSLKKVVCGAAPLPQEISDEFERRTGCTILEGYGMTETSAGAVLERMDRPRKKGSCGMAYPQTQLKVVDDDDRELPAGETGEVCIKGPMVMAGYYNNLEATAEALRDGWMHTGDVGRLDEEGYLYITERKKDLIIRGGFNIYPRDVEEVLYTHPAVAEAAVVGMPSAELGEEVKAYVVLKSGAETTEEALIAFCQEVLAKYKTPRAVAFLEALPKSPIGKILKRELREMARREAARS